jgi:hypothetical protein
VGRVSVYTEILSISSRARSCRSFGIVSIGNVEAVCGTRHVLRTIVESSSRRVRKLWTCVPSSSFFELASQGAVKQLWRYAVAQDYAKDQLGDLSNVALHARQFPQGLEAAERLLSHDPSAVDKLKVWLWH